MRAVFWLAETRMLRDTACADAFHTIVECYRHFTGTTCVSLCYVRSALQSSRGEIPLEK